MIACTVASTTEGALLFSSHGSVAAHIVALREVAGLEDFVPQLLAWCAAGALVGVSDALGRIALFTRLGEPLSLVSGPSPAAPLVSVLNSSDVTGGCVLTGHATLPAVLLCSASAAGVLELPYPNGAALLADMVQSTTPATPTTLSLWRSVVSLGSSVPIQATARLRRLLIEASGGYLCAFSMIPELTCFPITTEPGQQPPPRCRH